MEHSPVRLDLLVNLLYAAGENRIYYIDRVTGEALVVSDPFDEDDADESAEQLVEAEPERFAACPGWDTMEEEALYGRFAAQLPAGEIQDEALLAARSIHGRRIFAELIRDHPELRPAWEAFREKEYTQVARAWAEENGVPVLESNTGPAEAGGLG